MSSNSKIQDMRTPDIIDILIILAKWKHLILKVVLLVAVMASIVAFILPEKYTAITRILPPQQGQSSAAAMLQQLGGLASIAGSAAGIKSPSELYIGMLKSRTVADRIVDRFKLDDVYRSKYRSDSIKDLESATNIPSGSKDGIIAIEVEDKDPKRAADMANAYVDELYVLTRGLALTEAAQRRMFFEGQLQMARQNLSKAEIAAKDAIDSGGLIKVDDQGRGIVELSARLRGQIAVKEVEIQSMATFASAQNPALLAKKQELSSLENEVEKVEGRYQNETHKVGDSGSKSAINNLSLIRDVKYYETVLELMTKQYEVAKIDEAKDPALIQVVDRAIIPDKKSKPKRALIVLLATLLSLMALIPSLLVYEGVQVMKKDQEMNVRMAKLIEYMKWRKARV